MPAPRRTVLAIMATVAAIMCGTPLLKSRADDKPEAAASEALRNQRLDKVQKLEKTLKEQRDEIERQHDRNGVDPLDTKAAETTARTVYEKATASREEAEEAVKQFIEILAIDQQSGPPPGLGPMMIDPLREFAADGNHVYRQLAVEKAEADVDDETTKHEQWIQCDKAKELGDLRASVEKAKALEAASKAQIDIVRDRLTRKQKRIQAHRTIVPEDLAILVWDDAVDRERQAIALLTEVEQLEPKVGNDPKARKELEKKRGEAAKQHAESRRLLIEAFGVAKLVALSWTKIHDDEDELRYARQALVRSHPASETAGTVPTRSERKAAAIDVALRGRRDRVRVLEEKLSTQLKELRRRHADIRIETNGAVASATTAYETSRNAAEAASIAIPEYIEVIFPRDLERARERITNAEKELKELKELKGVQEREKRSGRAPEPLQVYRADFALQRAELALAQAKTMLEVLTKYEKGKTVKRLQAELDKARSSESAKEAFVSVERAKEAHARQLIEEYGTPDQEAIVVALTHRGVERSNRVVDLIIESQKLTAQPLTNVKEANERLARIEANRSEAKKLASSGAVVVTEAVKIAKQLSADWTPLLGIEQELSQARKSIANLEQLAAKKKLDR